MSERSEAQDELKLRPPKEKRQRSALLVEKACTMPLPITHARSSLKHTFWLPCDRWRTASLPSSGQAEGGPYKRRNDPRRRVKRTNNPQEGGASPSPTTVRNDQEAHESTWVENRHPEGLLFFLPDGESAAFGEKAEGGLADCFAGA